MRNLPAAKWEGQLGRAGPLQWMAMARGANTLGRGDSDGGPVPHSLVKVYCCVFRFSRWPQTSRGCPVVSKIG